MIVVADSGRLHYLILLDHTDLLRRFYGRVLVPEARTTQIDKFLRG
jgi:predicted nucleic acid-binding protein